jgi:rhomboid protease GluP
MKEILLRIKVNTRITYIIITINVLIWLAMTIAGGSTNSEVLILFGALFNPLIFAGEWWRLISSAFLHIGVFHLLINTYTLYQLGIVIEEFFGQKKFIATYILTAITASLLSILLTTGISAGASGALFGLTGLLLGNSWAKKIYSLDLPIDERQLIPFVIINLFYGFTAQGINNWAHIGGLLGGIVLGYIFDPANSFDSRKWKRLVPEILAYISIVLLIVSSLFWIVNIWSGIL